METFEQLGGVVVLGCSALDDPRSIPFASDVAPSDRQKEQMNFTKKADHQPDTQLRLGI